MARGWIRLALVAVLVAVGPSALAAAGDAEVERTPLAAPLNESAGGNATGDLAGNTGTLDPDATDSGGEVTADATNATGDATNANATNLTDEATGEVTDLADETTNLTDETTDDATNRTREADDATGETVNVTDEVATVTDELDDAVGDTEDTVDATGNVTDIASGRSEEVQDTATTTAEPAGDPETTTTTEAPAETNAPTDRPDDGAAAGGSGAGTTVAAAASDASDGEPAPDRGRPVGPAPDAVAGAGALAAAALAPQLADGLALAVNSGLGGLAPSASAGSASASASLSVGRLRSGTDRPWRVVAPFRYSRYDDSDPLDHDVRERLYEAVEAAPGAYLSAVCDRADVAVSTARHHLDVLEDEGLVTSAKVRGKRRYVPADGDRVELAAALADESSAAVLRALARLGEARGGRLADELDRDPSTVSHHLSRLEDAGLVEREREGRAVVNRLAPEVRAALGDGDEPAVAD